MKKIDYLIIGDNLFALTLAYYIAKMLNNTNILLIMEHTTPEGEDYYFYPSILLLPFNPNEFPVNQSIIDKSKNLLQEMQINYRSIEKKPIRLSLLFPKNEKERYYQYLTYLKKSSISYSIPEVRDLFEVYSFIKKVNRWHIIELTIHAYFDIKNIWEAYFQELQEMENVIIAKKKEITQELLDNIRKNIFITGHSCCSFSTPHEYNLSIAVQFPVIEQFPSIALMELGSRTIIWRDFEGFLWAYGDRSISKKKKQINTNNAQILTDIKKLIRIKELPVLDSFVSDTPKRFNVYLDNNKTVVITIPYYLQLTLSPAIASDIAQLCKEPEPLTLERILEKLTFSPRFAVDLN